MLVLQHMPNHESTVHEMVALAAWLAELEITASLEDVATLLTSIVADANRLSRFMESENASPMAVSLVHDANLRLET